MIRTEEENRPCVGCGYCCIRQTCTYGIQRHPQAAAEICPELQWNGKRYVCRVMTFPAGGMNAFYREQLQAGMGCRSHLNPWRRDVRPRSKEDLQDVPKN